MQGIIQAMERVSFYADRVARVMCVLTALAFLLILLTQVFVRYLLEGSLPWYADAVRLSFKWSLFLGMAIAYKSRAHIEFPFLVDKLPLHVRQIVVTSGRSLTLVFFVFLVWGGTKYTGQLAVKMYSVLGISEGWSAVSLPIAMSIACIHAAYFLLEDVRNLLPSAPGPPMMREGTP